MFLINQFVTIKTGCKRLKCPKDAKDWVFVVSMLLQGEHCLHSIDGLRQSRTESDLV